MNLAQLRVTAWPFLLFVSPNWLLENEPSTTENDGLVVSPNWLLDNEPSTTKSDGLVVSPNWLLENEPSS